MFNKQGPSVRDEPIVRKEIRSFLTPGTTPATQPAADLSTRSALQGGSASEAPVTPAPVTPEAVPGTENSVSEARLIVGPDVKPGGAEILDCDTLVVEGRVEATMDSRVIRIAEQGAFTGKVSIDIAEIHGRFEGNSPHVRS